MIRIGGHRYKRATTVCDRCGEFVKNVSVELDFRTKDWKSKKWFRSSHGAGLCDACYEEVLVNTAVELRKKIEKLGSKNLKTRLELAQLKKFKAIERKEKARVREQKKTENKDINVMGAIF